MTMDRLLPHINSDITKSRLLVEHVELFEGLLPQGVSFIHSVPLTLLYNLCLGGNVCHGDVGGDM